MLEKSGHFGSNNANTLDGMIFLRYIAPQDQQRFTVPHSIDCVLRKCGLTGCFKCSNDFRGRCSIRLFVNCLRAVEPLPHVLFLYGLHRIQSWATEWNTKVSHKLVGCDAIVLCHEQWTCASCEHLPPRIFLLSPLKPMLQRGLCTWTWRISDMNRAARWLIHVPSSYQILPACLSCLLITTTQIIKLLQKLRMSWIGWCIRYIFCFGGWILWWKPPPQKKNSDSSYDRRGAFSPCWTL